MKKYFYRVTLEHPNGKVRKLQISRRFLSLSILGIVISISTLSVYLFLSGIHFQEKNSQIEIKVLKKRTKFLGLENRKYKEELGKLESKLNHLHLLEKKIKEIFHIEGIENENSVARSRGLGGPVINVLKNPSLESIFIKQEDKFFHEDVEKVWNEVSQKEERFSTILEILKNRGGYPYFLTPQWPVLGAINSGFGVRYDPLTGERAYHEGIDISADVWTPIKAASDGRVIFSGWDVSGYGRMVIIDHGNGYLTRYAHNVANVVTAGEKVKKGEVIAYVGSTGRSTGPHLHFEVIYKNVPTNPMKFLFN